MPVVPKIDWTRYIEARQARTRIAMKEMVDEFLATQARRMAELHKLEDAAWLERALKVLSMD